jgi:predicted ATPase/DNA-binding winged helix-turn-helix (wHTH) protein
MPKKQDWSDCFRLVRGKSVDINPVQYQFGNFTLDVARGCVFKAGEEIRLRPKVYETLKYLVQHPGRLIGKQELLEAVWPDAFVTDDSLVQCTVELRRALDDQEQQLLKTVPRRGYVFAASVIEKSGTADNVPAIASPSFADSGKMPLPKPASKRRDLPTPGNALIGREQEVKEAADLLLRPHVRLLTVTGPGGSGKTRLALAVATAVAEKFTGGVQFLGLASITHPDLVATALAKALDIQQAAHHKLPQLISEQLQESGPFLLVLDNFEQVLSAATLLAQILTSCPSLKILVTSRSGLRIYGEQEFPLRPLPQNSAIELFVQRATAVRPNFVITPENRPAIEEICRRLDGLPLAIELAAARTKVLSPAAMLNRLQSRLQLLTGGALDLPERQQTLRGAIDWSHELLNEAEQRLFRRLSVFAGGCTLEAAEAVCNTARDLGIDPFDGLASLVDKNLVQRMEGLDAEPRFAMLETIREYALERLGTSKEESLARRAHAAYALVLAEEGNPDLSGADRSAWLARCDTEVDNFRGALDWLFEHQELDWALRLCMALFRFWDMRDHQIEGRARLEKLLQLTGVGYTRERAKICIFLGALATTPGDFTAAQTFLEQSLSLYEELGDRWGIAASLNALAVNARDSGDYLSAQATFERSLACWRTLEHRLSVARCLHNLASVVQVLGDYDRAHEALREATGIFEDVGDRIGAAWSINQEGDVALEQGDLVAAHDLYQRALSSFRETGDRWGCGRSLTDLGHIYCLQGNYAGAHAAYVEALHLSAGLEHRRGIARALEGFASLAAHEGHAARALKLAAAATHLRRLISVPLPQSEQSRLDRCLLLARKSLSEAQQKEVWSEGLAMGTAEAMRYCLERQQSATLPS